MGGAFRWMRSTVGMKAQMAVSGFLLFAFVFFHMAGNLKAFQGAEAFNHYAEYIREIGSPILPHGAFLWGNRIGLLAVVVLHGVLAVRLARRAKRARPQRYKQQPDLGFSYASRTMRWGGVIIATFVIYHLMHLTTGTAHSQFVAGDPYHNLISGLSNPFVALAYVVAVSALALHLYHGLWSATRTVGVGGRLDALRRPVVAAVTAAMWFGYLSIPVAIQLGVLRP